MYIGMATFEHLPVRVGGLAEAVTSLAEALNKEHNVMVFMPSHGLLDGRADFHVGEYADFRISVGDCIYPVKVYEGRRNGVRMFLLHNEALSHPKVYSPRDKFIQKMVHFTKALPGLINLILKKEKIKLDVIHINDWHCVFAGTLLKKYFKIPFVFTIHRLCHEKMSVHELNEVNLGELVKPKYLEGEMFNIESFGGHQCDYLTTVSFSYLNEMWSTFFSTFEGKVTYVWNGMDYTFWNQEELKKAHLPRAERRKEILAENGLDDGIMFFNVGRLDIAQKGIDVLFEAFRLIMEGQIEGSEDIRDKVRFVLLGSGNPTLEEDARKLQEKYPRNMKALIKYLGREATREFYGAADFCVIPSKFEPFGLVQLEAMCMGCIPIGSRVGGINDTVISIEEDREKATGKLVSPRDPHALARAMVDMAYLVATDGKVIESMRQNGRKHVIDNFTWDKAAQRYLEVYRNMATMKLPFVVYSEPY